MRRLLVLASVIVFLDSAFYAAITPILPQLAEEFGLGKTGAGVLVAAYPAGTLVGALPGGLIASRLGVRPTVLIGLGLMVVTSVTFAFAQTIVVLDAARFVQGVGSALSWAGAMGWLIGSAPPERRGEMIGSAMGAAIVGVLLGPVLGGAAHAFGRAAVFCGVALAGVVLIIASLRIPGRRPGTMPRLRELAYAARDPKVALGMWLTTLPGLIFGTLQVLTPLRLAELGATATAIAACFLGAAALEAVVSPYSGRVSDRLGRAAPLLFGLCAGVITMLLIPWPESAWALGALIVIGSPGIGALWAPAMAMLTDGTEAHGLEPAFGFALVNIAWAVGEGVGAAGSARVSDAAGTDAVPYLLLAAICAGSAVLVRRSRRPVASLARQ